MIVFILKGKRSFPFRVDTIYLKPQHGIEN